MPHNNRQDDETPNHTSILLFFTKSENQNLLSPEKLYSDVLSHLEQLYNTCYHPSNILNAFLKYYMTTDNKRDEKRLLREYTAPFCDKVNALRKDKIFFEQKQKVIKSMHELYRQFISEDSESFNFTTENPEESEQLKTSKSPRESSSPRSSLSNGVSKSPLSKLASSSQRLTTQLQSTNSAIAMRRPHAKTSASRIIASHRNHLERRGSDLGSPSLYSRKHRFSKSSADLFKEVMKDKSDDDENSDDMTLLFLQKASNVNKHISGHIESLSSWHSTLKSENANHSILNLIQNQIRWLNRLSQYLSGNEKSSRLSQHHNEQELRELCNGCVRSIDLNFKNIALEINDKMSQLDEDTNKLNQAIKTFLEDIKTLTDFECIIKQFDFKRAENNRTPIGKLSADVGEQYMEQHKDNKSHEIMPYIYTLIQNINSLRKMYNTLAYELNFSQFQYGTVDLKSAFLGANEVDNVNSLFTEATSVQAENIKDKAIENYKTLCLVTNLCDKEYKNVRHSISVKLKTPNLEGTITSQLKALKEEIETSQKYFRTLKEAYETLSITRKLKNHDQTPASATLSPR